MNWKDFNGSCCCKRQMPWLAGFLHEVPFDNSPLPSHKLDCHRGSITTRLRLNAPFVVPFSPHTGNGRVELGKYSANDSLYVTLVYITLM
jgi:hypothetical protein